MSPQTTEEGFHVKDARKLTPSPIRLPEELKIWLKHKAIDNYRSLNSEIIARLEESRKKEEESAKAA